MGSIKLLLVIGVLYFSQSYYLLTENHIEKFLVGQNVLVMSDPVQACHTYSDNIQVNIKHQTPQGTWEVEGGKRELCGYLKQSQAALVVTQASTQGHFENMHISKGFLWLTASASFDEITQVSIKGMDAIITKTHEVIQLKRTLTGLEITEITSTGSVEF